MDMEAAASARVPAPHRMRIPTVESSSDASSSSSSSSSPSPSPSRVADLRAGACEAGGEGGILDLDSRWAAPAEAERILGEAAAALQISGEKEHKDEDEIRDNQQRQEDELMALEAIYGHDLAVFENIGGLHYFQICIRYDVADGVEVHAKLSSANVCAKDEGCSDGTGQSDGLDVFSYKCNFEYLPPLILTCLLPLSYRRKDPPYFTITVKCMDAPQVSQLCDMLHTIWAELKGQEVVYQWVEWLRDSSRSHLWFDGKITLGTDIIITHDRYNHAISRTNSLESVIPLMMSYCSKKHYQAFLEDLHMCMICLNQSKGSNFVRLSCQHFFCLKCMETLCRMHVKEGSVFQLLCPDTKCNASIPPFVLKRLLTEEEFERWDRLVLKKALDSMSDVVYCPRCGIGCLEDESNDAECPKCSFIFCSLCKEPCHPAKQCITPEEKIKRQQASGKMSDKEMARELLTIRKLFSDIQLCPKCRMPIVKTEGCNKMSCGNCGQLLCFRCGRAISGYDHFWNECKLFELRQYSDVTPFERHMEEVQIGRRVKVQLTPIGSTIRCPKCRQRNFKIYIRYDVADGVKVCAKLSAPNTSTRDVGCFDGSEQDYGPDEFSYTCNFEYLPPLILTCLLPKSYPSKDPPSFAATVKWMDGPYVSQLCEMLDTIWAELSGQKVVYQWVEWLRNTSRSYLWTDGSMTLGPDIATHNTDIRAIPRTKSLESAIPLMLSYRSKKRYQAFLEDLHMCMICLNQTKGSKFIKLPCGHLFCVKCMETLCRMHVKEGSVFQLVCPGTKCKASIPPYVLKRLLTKEQFERWDRLLLQKTLDSISDIVFCPRCVIGCVEDEDNNAQCPECSFIFCSFCKGPWHPGKQCLTPEQKIQLRKASGRMTEREVAEELRNIRELYKDVRLCPKCRMAIAKTAGCNKMTCGNCGQYFCFTCGKAINGYEHFR